MFSEHRLKPERNHRTFTRWRTDPDGWCNSHLLLFGEVSRIVGATYN